jgi:hypothetical protein
MLEVCEVCGGPAPVRFRRMRVGWRGWWDLITGRAEWRRACLDHFPEVARTIL